MSSGSHSPPAGMTATRPPGAVTRAASARNPATSGTSWSTHTTTTFGTAPSGTGRW